MEQTAVVVPVENKDKRKHPRAKISRLVLVRSPDPKHRKEVTATVNVSRDGFYFVTPAKHYYMGMHLSVTLGYEPNDPCASSSLGKVMRIDQLEDGRFGIAVRILLK
jgi:PilZ domain